MGFIRGRKNSNIYKYVFTDKQAKVKKLEKEIDQLVYKLYELTPDEIKIVDGFGK